MNSKENVKVEVSVEQLAKLRIGIARYGEMDRRKWWNTKGMLSNVGELAIARGFTKTHVFARCRATFAVAAARSDEVFNPPDSFTLWHLPAEIEDQLEDAWASWLEAPQPWQDFLQEVDRHSAKEPVEGLLELGLISEQAVAKASRLRRADDYRSVPIKLNGESIKEAIELLAAAHSSSEVNKLAVPFIRQQEFPK